MDRAGLLALAERVLTGSGKDNALDVEIEIALFVPDREMQSVRANAAGTKVIYTDIGGGEQTYWAEEWTGNRLKATSELHALAAQQESR